MDALQVLFLNALSVHLQQMQGRLTSVRMANNLLLSIWVIFALLNWRTMAFEALTLKGAKFESLYLL